MSRAYRFVAMGGSVAGFEAEPAEVPEIQDFILQHGPTPEGWNYLPEDKVREYLQGIATGAAFGLVARSSVEGNPLVGVVTYDIKHTFPQYQPAGRENVVQGYVSEIVVSSGEVRGQAVRGHGLGTKLLVGAIEMLTRDPARHGPGHHNVQEVYALRHADNVPSGKTMESAGMVWVDTYDDPIRTTDTGEAIGSGKTTVTRYEAPVREDVA